MILTNLKGGMGNQMFQFAATYALSRSKGLSFALDTRFLVEFKEKRPNGYVVRDYALDLFGIDPGRLDGLDLAKTFQVSSNYLIRSILGKINSMLLGFVIRQNESEEYINLTAINKNTVYLDGYWQSSNYFIEYSDDIKSIFLRGRANSEEKFSKLFSEILPDNDVCLNVRRTDFIGSPTHDIVTSNYYFKAIEMLKSKINVRYIYVFSDDLAWCKREFNGLKNVRYVEHEYAGERFIDYLYLMTTFKNFIIPNSTFAWWAAWLSVYGYENVIVPMGWPIISADEVVSREWTPL